MNRRSISRISDPELRRAAYARHCRPSLKNQKDLVMAAARKLERDSGEPQPKTASGRTPAKA